MGFIPPSSNLELLARAGYGGAALTYETDQGGYVGDADGASWNYGAGAQFLFDEANGFRRDFTRKDDPHDRGEADEVSVVEVRRFQPAAVMEGARLSASPSRGEGTGLRLAGRRASPGGT